MHGFENRTAIVTGGAAGIGRALSERLGESGARVVVADLNGQGAEEVAAMIRKRGGRAAATQVDVSSAAQVEALINDTATRHGRLDFLFNNAGVAAVGELRDGNLEDFRRVVDVNLFGVVHGTLAAYRVMLRQRSGHIVNIASAAGLMATPLLTAYGASKSAIVGFSTSLRLEAAGLGVKVSVACPGLVRTDIGERNAYWNVRKSEYLEWLPLKRLMLSPTRAANAILRGTMRNREIMVFPFLTWVGWRVYQICPRLFDPLMRRTLEGFRSLRLKP